MYGSENVNLSSRPSMVKPFQMQLMVPLPMSASFASQSIAWRSRFQPIFSHTALASSRSKPVNCPSSPT